MGMRFTFKAQAHCDGLFNVEPRCSATGEATVTGTAARLRVGSVPDDLDVFDVVLPDGWEIYGCEDWQCPRCVATREDRLREERKRR